MTKIECCLSCKYYKSSGCSHPYAYTCKHADWWTPDWFEVINDEQN